MCRVWIIAGAVGIVFTLLFLSGCQEGAASTLGEEAQKVSTAKKKPVPFVFRAKVAKQAVEALPGVYASYSVASVYMIDCGDQYIMVDCGLLRDVETHLDNFEKIGIDLKRVAAIFASHFHYDHVSGIARAKEILGCKVVAHRENAHAIETGDDLVTARKMPYIPNYSFPFPPCEVDYVVEDGDVLKIGRKEFTVYHIPGHTAGDTGYFWDGHLVVGDLLYQGGGTGWRDVHWGSNYHDMIESMNRIKAINPTYCLPGHGRPWEYQLSESDKVIEFAEGELSKGPFSPVFFTGQHSGIRERDPRTITIR